MDSRASGLPHLDLLADAVGRFADALDAAVAADALDRPVPPLRWTVGEVAAHLAGVHRWCAGLVREGRRPQRGSVPAGRDGLAATYRQEAADMLDVLRAADPDQPCWTMDRTDRRAAFWPRRQLHEVVVHLWDVRSVDDPTPGALADVPADVAADGVDELLQMAATRLGANRAPLPGPLALHATDTGTRWLLGTDWLLADPARTAPRPRRRSRPPPGRCCCTSGAAGRSPPPPATRHVLRAFDRATIRA